MGSAYNRNPTCEAGAAHERLAEQIRRELTERNPSSQEPLPSYRDLSRRHGVSLSTVQRAMDVLQSEGVVRRLDRRGAFYQPPARMQSATAIPTPVAATTRLKCVNIIWAAPAGIRTFDTVREAYLSGYTEALDQCGAAMRFVRPPRDVQPEQVLSPNVAPHEQGCLFVFREFDLRLTDWMVGHGVPYVIQDSRPYFGKGRDLHHRICPNKPGGVARATQHLIALGHQRIGFVGRIAADPGGCSPAFESTMIAGNLMPQQRYMLNLATDLPEVARPPLREYLRRGDVPTAVMVRGDAMALTLLEEAKAMGLQVPRDLSIIGLNGEPETETSDPPLTTVLVPYRRLAREAVALLMEVAAGKHREFQWRMLDCALIVRDSTAPPRSLESAAAEAPGESPSSVRGAATTGTTP